VDDSFTVVIALKFGYFTYPIIDRFSLAQNIADSITSGWTSRAFEHIIICTIVAISRRYYRIDKLGFIVGKLITDVVVAGVVGGRPTVDVVIKVLVERGESFRLLFIDTITQTTTTAPMMARSFCCFCINPLPTKVKELAPAIVLRKR
jgi:hypothetical protein